MPVVHCVDCQTPYPEIGLPFRCPACGGIYDFDAPPDFEPKKVEKGLPGYWRYRHAFSLFENAPMVTLGEGNTPLIWMEEENQKVGLKMEHLNPTGSYKDRGSAVLVSQLIGRGATRAVEEFIWECRGFLCSVCSPGWIESPGLCARNGFWAEASAN